MSRQGPLATARAARGIGKIGLDDGLNFG